MNKPTAPTSTVHSFTNATIYNAGLFGIRRIDCKTITITTGQKYAQYTDAIRVEFLVKGKRKPQAIILDYRPWLRVLPTAHAIDPDDWMIHRGDGSSVSRYTSCSDNYAIDFEAKLSASGVEPLYTVGDYTAELGAQAIAKANGESLAEDEG